MNGSGTLPLVFLSLFCCIRSLTRTRRAHIGTLVTHIYTRIYIHTFYQTDIRKCDFLLLFYRFDRFGEKETGGLSHTANWRFLGVVLSDRIPGLPPPPPYTYTLHVGRLTVACVFSACCAFRCCLRRPEPKPEPDP